ncbi:MAG: hypothetical protein ACOYO1_12875 [Bacteroidales bacterium]
MSEYTEQNEIVKQWRNVVLRDLKNSTSGFVHGKKGMIKRKGRSEEKLTDSFKGKIHLFYNVADAVTFSFERHGIFVHKGVGKGYTSSNNMVTKYSKNPDGSRDKVDWANPVMDKNTPLLADKIAEINANAVVNAARGRIE